jgi:catechol 2,3-dioxygenase-like lactoylglutathione lyase family enzyme
MFGSFLEVAIATADIAASVEFYERLGFKQLLTGDSWPHRYGVLSDGRIQLGLHERVMPSPSLSFVLPELAQARARLSAAGMEPELAQLGEEQLHELRLRDPADAPITLLEARTYSPAAPGSMNDSLCGYFLHLSLPESDFKIARRFWERAGMVALPEVKLPYPHVPLTSDGLDLAFHRRRLCATPVLVFECADLTQRRAELRARNIPSSDTLPRSLKAAGCILIEAPEGTQLWILGSVA